MATDKPRGQSDVRRFRKAADQRLTAAEVLRRGRCYLEAMYLAGYTVECALKALLLAGTSGRERERTIQDHFRGARGHELESLKKALAERNYHMPSEVIWAFRRCATWAPDLRYAVGLGSPEDADRFIAGARAVRDWVTRSL